MILRRSKRDKNFTVIDNAIINDKNLKAISRAVLIYILSKPDDWQIRKTDLYKQFPLDTKNAIDKAVKNCRDAGYARLKPITCDDGTFAGQQYVFSESPVYTQSTENGGSSSLGDPGDSEKSETRRSSRSLPNTDPLPNTDLLSSNKDQSKKVSTDLAPNGADAHKPTSKQKSKPKKKAKTETFADRPLDAPMTLQDFAAYMRKSNRRDLKIIAWFAEKENKEFTTAGQWQIFFKRHLRPATQLSHFTNEQIQKAYNDVRQANHLTEFTLETLIKHITNGTKRWISVTEMPEFNDEIREETPLDA